MGVEFKYPPWMIRWRLRVVMAEINISNKELSERSGVHKVTISKLRNTDELRQITGDVLNKLCNGLTQAYRDKGLDTVITPGHLIVYTPDDPENIPQKTNGRRKQAQEAALTAVDVSTSSASEIKGVA